MKYGWVGHPVDWSAFDPTLTTASTFGVVDLDAALALALELVCVCRTVSRKPTVVCLPCHIGR